MVILSVLLAYVPVQFTKTKWRLDVCSSYCLCQLVLARCMAATVLGKEVSSFWPCCSPHQLSVFMPCWALLLACCLVKKKKLFYLHNNMHNICWGHSRSFGLLKGHHGIMVDEPWHVFSNNASQPLHVDSIFSCLLFNNRFNGEYCALLWCAGLALAAPHRDIYSGLWGYNSALSCIAIGGVFYVLTWQTHLLALICGKIDKQYDHCQLKWVFHLKKWQNVLLPAIFCAYMTSAISKLMSVVSKNFLPKSNSINVIWTSRCLSCHVTPLLFYDIPFQFALPACTWPFCLSTFIFLLISSEIPAICRLPLSVVSYPEENRHYQRQLEALQKAQHSQQSGGQEEAPLKENGGPNVPLVLEEGCSDALLSWYFPLWVSNCRKCWNGMDIYKCSSFM